MRLVITGGGTGGHIYPALEVGRLAEKDGAELLYLGSLRGQEGEICRRLGIRFEGFPSEPVYSLKTPRGWKALARLAKATKLAKVALRAAHPDVVFSTGGYSAAPIMAAARSLRIPYVIHESNSVPGRSNRMFAAKAKAVSCVFHATLQHLPMAVRTGQPIREELRSAVGQRNPATNEVIVLGGSQGSAFLNEAVIGAGRLNNAQFLLAAGKGNFEKIKDQASEKLRIYPFLEAPELVQGYQQATIAIARSGGTVAEFAMFGLPSILIPLPSSADDHQLHNARELASLGGATVLEQSHVTAESLSRAVDEWLSDAERRERAAKVLMDWDVPDATERIVRLMG